MKVIKTQNELVDLTHASQLPIGSLGKDFSSVAALRSHIS